MLNAYATITAKIMKFNTRSDFFAVIVPYGFYRGDASQCQGFLQFLQGFWCLVGLWYTFLKKYYMPWLHVDFFHFCFLQI